MDGAQDGAVGGGGADVLESGVKLLGIHLPEHFFAEEGGHLAALHGDGGVLVGEIGVVGAGVHDAQRVAQRAEIQRQVVHHGIGRVLEVDEHHAAHGGGSLIHEAGGLAEVDVFGVLADLGDGHGGELLTKEQLIEDGADEHLKGGGGAQAAAGEDGGAHLGVEALELGAALGEGGGHAADEGGGGVFLLGVDGEVGQVNLHRGVAFGGHGDDAAVIEGHLRHGFQVDGGSQHAAVLVVGVIAADLGAAGSRKMINLRHISSSQSQVVVDSPVFFIYNNTTKPRKRKGGNHCVGKKRSTGIERNHPPRQQRKPGIYPSPGGAGICFVYAHQCHCGLFPGRG